MLLKTPVILWDAIFIFLLLISVPDLLARRNAKLHWKKLTGKLTGISPQRIGSWRIVAFALEYMYEYDGQSFSGKDRRPKYLVPSNMSIGETVTVFVNPINAKQSFFCPSEHNLYDRWRTKIWILLALLLIVGTISAFS